ncbi:hypothetical protein [Amycolatopsis sp. GM8]|uniref:hypothetical protein n=1 Tax=Amycolatopsis sp. GM8 TaxID=2896530 RepID=UPI001F280856|nr:hypothetical protein [Amycolatopsis sp. GM8]
MSSTAAADPIGRDVVIRHLQALGSLEAETGPSLPLGITGVRLEPDGSLSLDGRNLVMTERRLSDLLDVDPGIRYLADPDAASELYRSGQDPVLYRAVRRFLPSRSLTSRDLVVAGNDDEARGLLTADLVVYEPGVLPGGEPFRSTGHWNLPGQLEIFEVLSGRIAMLVAGRNRSGEAFAYVQICPAGTTMAVPFDIWHVSYVLDGPAVVFNVSARLQEAGLAAGTDKYHRAKAVGLTLKRDLTVVGDDDAFREWGTPGGAPATDWFTDLLAPGQSLADLHVHGSPEQLSTVVRTALDAYDEGWPMMPR